MRPALLLLLVLLLAGCRGQQGELPHLRLATTTSTYDSGLLDEILPDFEQRYGARVDVIAVGTGQALEIARHGDVDVVLVHARDQEYAFINEGHGLERREVMYNDFIVVGPGADPARIKGSLTAAQALHRIAAAQGLFASRGDRSGTHIKEQELWRLTGLQPQAGQWYRSLGQGMGETLIFANEQQAYTLTDRGTYLSLRAKLPELEILFGGMTLADNPDPTLRNEYGVIPVDQRRHPEVNGRLAAEFARWITAPPAQQKIAAFGVDRYGQPLFHPNAAVSTQSLPPAPPESVAAPTRLHASKPSR